MGGGAQRRGSLSPQRTDRPDAVGGPERHDPGTRCEEQAQVSAPHEPRKPRHDAEADALVGLGLGNQGEELDGEIPDAARDRLEALDRARSEAEDEVGVWRGAGQQPQVA